MTRARKEQISLADTAYYHCISRCVRRAFLCGEDRFTGRSYDHRRQWILERLTLLDQVFAIDICAYAIMSNHYHLVLYINQSEVDAWSDDEVIERWMRLFTGPMLVHRYIRGECKTQAEYKKVAEIIALWRERLADISWFMKCLNEYIARRANAEDQCKGHFWESRFKCQALLDEAGLLTCMAYVDLNPVRAVMASCPEESDFTSVQQRIREYHAERNNPDNPVLKGFSARQADSHCCIAFDYADYLELVDWSGRCCRQDKRGAIGAAIPPILERLNIAPDAWMVAMRPSGFPLNRALGRQDRMRRYASDNGCRWIQGKVPAAQFFN